ncbi:MAG: hypothetical protein NC131_03660 [Roseburia sp.]|nr:hypothetical protein [Roseburia sp.]
MKNKKIITMISAVAMAATLGVASVAGCNKGGGHVHAYNWTTDYEATCVAPGQRTGRCVCGDIKPEVIPVDPNAHEYNEWNISEYPTEEREGTATRTCKLSGGHTFSATLPKITEAGTGYLSSEITQNPTIISEGNRHFIFSHAAGALEFDIKLPKRSEVTTVEDAVLLSSSLHDTIRESSGRYQMGASEDDGNGNEEEGAFTSYYGDDYVRVYDAANKTGYWFSRDENGNPFGIYAVTDRIITNAPDDPEQVFDPEFEYISREPALKSDTTEKDLLGFGYASGGGIQRTYGAEDTLLTYYQASQSETAIKYESTFKKSQGEVECAFSFSRKEQTYFCRYNVEFSLFTTGAIKTLSVTTKIIRPFMLANTFDGTNVGETVYDDDGDVIFGEIYPIGNDGSEQYETNYEYEKDENGDIIYDFVYEYVTNSFNQIQYDSAGDPIIKTDGSGNPVYVLDKDGNPQKEPRKKYTYEYVKDEDGKFVLDEKGEKIIAIGTDGGKIKYPVVGDPTIVIDGVKQKPDGSPLLDRHGNEIARPVPLGFNEEEGRQYYYEKGDKKYDGTDDVYEEDHPYIATRFVTYSQKLKVEGETVEPNTYPPESVYIRSFGVSYNGAPVTEERLEITANDAIYFYISDVQPSETATLERDPLKVYLKTGTGEIELNYRGTDDFGQNAYHMVANFSTESKRVYFRAQSAGEYTIVLRTVSGKCEREINLDIKKGKPTALTSYVYTYSDAKGVEEHVWTEFVNGETSPVELYVGQPLYVRAAALSTEASYVDDSFLATVSSTYSSYFEIENDVTLKDNNGNEVKASKVTPLKPTTVTSGVRIYLDSVFLDSSGKNPVASAQLRVKVTEAPDLSDMLSGEYAGKFTYIALVEGSSTLRPADVKVTLVPDSANAAQGEIRVEVSGSDGNVIQCKYSFSYDEATKTLTSALIDGRTDDTFLFEFGLNEVYKLTIKHTTYPGRSETVVLSRPKSV